MTKSESIALHIATFTLGRFADEQKAKGNISNYEALEACRMQVLSTTCTSRRLKKAFAGYAADHCQKAKELRNAESQSQPAPSFDPQK